MTDVLLSPIARMHVDPIGAHFPDAVVSLELVDGSTFLADLTTPIYRELLLDITLSRFPVRWICGLPSGV
jgi:hypothetical protein